MKKPCFLILVVLVFCSCKKNTDNASATQVDVYVAGWEFNGTSIVAKYWKNGEANALTNGPDWAWANSIDVVGSNVYVAGYEFNRLVNVAKYWKNTHRITLTTNNPQVYSTSMVVVKR